MSWSSIPGKNEVLSQLERRCCKLTKSSPSNLFRHLFLPSLAGSKSSMWPVSPRSLSLKVSRSHWRMLVVLATLQSELTLPRKAVLKTWPTTLFHFVFKGGLFARWMYPSRHQLPNPLPSVFSAPSPLFHLLQAVAQHIEYLHERQVPVLSPPHLQCSRILIFACTRPPQRLSVTMPIYCSLVAEQPVTVCPHNTSAKVLALVFPCEGKLPLFLGSPQQEPPHLPVEYTLSGETQSHSSRSKRSRHVLHLRQRAPHAHALPVKGKILDAAEGLATSNAALHLKNYGSKSFRRSSCHSHNRWSIFASNFCKCSQLTPRSAPTCRFLHSIGSFSVCSKSFRTVVYDLKNTLSSAIAPNPRGPFSNLVSVC